MGRSLACSSVLDLVNHYYHFIEILSVRLDVSIPCLKLIEEDLLVALRLPVSDLLYLYSALEAA